MPTTRSKVDLASGEMSTGGASNRSPIAGSISGPATLSAWSVWSGSSQAALVTRRAVIERAGNLRPRASGFWRSEPAGLFGVGSDPEVARRLTSPSTSERPNG